MPDTASIAITEQDWQIRIDAGRLFAKSWAPAGGDAGGRNADGGAPVLLFHDSLGSVGLWRSFPRALAAATRRRVVAYDRLGFGRSDPYPGVLRPDFIAWEGRHVVPRLCAELGIDAFIACGHSVGGGMAVETAAHLPGQCRALVTIAAQAFIEDRTLEGIRLAQRDFQDPANLRRLARYHGDKAAWVVKAWIETWLSPAFAGWTLAAALAKVQCPVLAIHGEHDEYGSAEHPTRIAAGIAGGQGIAHILPETGHVPHREREELLVEVIARFLEGK